MVKPENVLRTLFRGTTGNSITRDEVLRKITVKTFNNYSPLLRKAGLITVEKKDPNDKRIITKLRLTQLGKEVLNSAGEEVVKMATVTGKARIISSNLDLEEITRLTDEFTRRNPSWVWELKRRQEVESK